MKHRATSSQRPPGQVRIIGGEWRSRRLPVTPGDRIRPSGDRVRETLFNWLMPSLPGARCLDLFAGTGALAFEAVSRGAASATMIDIDPAICRQLSDNIAAFHSERLSVHCADALRWLQTASGGTYDIIFLDPPFGGDYLDRALALLDPFCVHDDSIVYVEHDQDLDTIELATHFEWFKRSRIGKVHIGLCRFSVT